MKEDYYKTLGVDKSIDQKELKKAFRSMAMKYHPDRNKDKDAEKKFKEASEAYNILSDPEKKKLYDNYGHAGLDGVPRNYSSHNPQDIFNNFGDIFGDIFGFGRSKGGPQSRGQDIHFSIKISLENTIKDGKITIDIPRKLNCHICNGTGCAKDTHPTTCLSCNGAGSNIHRQGYVNIQTSCKTCKGLGNIIKEKCKSCNGSKVEEKIEKLKVSIPAGIENGMKVKLSRKGHAFGDSYIPGDLYLTILLKPHDLFEKQGRNIIYDLGIDFVTACLGGEVEVPTLYGKCKVKIPRGIQNNDIIKLKRKGYPAISRDNFIGDQFNKVVIKIPKTLSKEEESLLKNLKKIKSF